MTSEYCLTVRDVPIATLGPAKIPSPLMYDKGMLDTGKVLLCLTHEYDEDLQKPQFLLF